MQAWLKRFRANSSASRAFKSIAGKTAGGGAAAVLSERLAPLRQSSTLRVTSPMPQLSRDLGSPSKPLSRLTLRFLRPLPSPSSFRYVLRIPGGDSALLLQEKQQLGRLGKCEGSSSACLIQAILEHQSHLTSPLQGVYLTSRAQYRIASSITSGDKLHLWPSPQQLLSYACSSNDSDSRNTPGRIHKPSFGSRESLRCQFGMSTRGSAPGMFGIKLQP